MYCKLCFKEIKDNSFYNFLHKNSEVCQECFKSFRAKFIRFQIGSISGVAIYEYDETIKKLIYMFKGCYDIELKNIFLERYLWYLRFKYKDYYLVPVPSHILDDQKRGFNHVVEIFSGLKLPYLNVIKKANKNKQAKNTKKKRINSGNSFGVEGDINIVRGKKILIVDDVYTTGSSVNAVIKLVKKGGPKKIEVLVISKNIEKHKNY